MSKKLFLNSIKYLSVFGLVFFCGVNLALAKENSSLNVESRVSATASSGGNTISGSGTITTGDATATVKSTNVINGGENVKIVTEAQAQTGGKTGTASVEANGEKKSCTADNGSGCQVEMNTSGEAVVCAEGDDCEIFVKSAEELAEEERIFQEEKLIEETIDLEEIVEPKKGFGQVMQDFFSGMADRVWSWF
jgi:hypothetical protein